MRVDTYHPQFISGRQSLLRPVLAWSAVAFCSLALVGLILGAPLLLADGRYDLAHSIYQAFRYVCHQMPERSFQLAGHSFAVCARCTGLYFGFAAGTLLYPLVRSLRRTDAPRRLWLMVATLPILIDFSLGYFGLWENTHLSRLLTGLLLGSVSAFYVLPGLIEISLSAWTRTRARRDADKSAPQSPRLTAPERVDVPSDYSSPHARI